MDTWHAVEADTPFGLIRGLVSGDKIGLASMKAISLDEFLEWGRRRLGDEVHIEVAALDGAESERFRSDVQRLLDGQSARLTPDFSSNTPFQLQVAEAVQQIPYGQTASYGDVAVAVGKPGGAQAVGRRRRLRIALAFAGRGLKTYRSGPVFARLRAIHAHSRSGTLGVRPGDSTAVGFGDCRRYVAAAACEFVMQNLFR